MKRTRVKICGITRAEDARAACEAGADAVGLVFYPPSPRVLALEQAAALRRSLAPYVTAVALFVNPAKEEVERVIERVRPDLLQFHGEESPDFCGRFGLPYIKAARVKSGDREGDLLKYLRAFPEASGWMLDAHVGEYGGVGASFEWSLVPVARERPVILSGGLTPANVGEAVRLVRPWAVDVSTGVESAKGIKDARKIAAFIEEVHHADV